MDNIDKVLVISEPERLQNQTVLELEEIRLAIRGLLDILPKKYSWELQQLSWSSFFVS